jgi:small subunit ribosomal protein S3
MGRKVHPYGFRIGTVRDWRAKWHADKHFADMLQEDLKLRKTIDDSYKDAGISQVEIERQANKVTVTIFTARPGIVIGRGGQRVDEMRRLLEKTIGKKVALNIQEIGQPELDAFLVARNVADQISRRIAYRRAMKQAISRTLQAGAQGVKIRCAGRLAGAEIARVQTMHQGRVPLHTLRADIDYGCTKAKTAMGDIGVKVWVYRGDILPEIEEPAFEEPAAEGAVAAPVEEKPKAKAKKPKPVAVVEEEEEKPEVETETEAVAEKKPAKAKATKAKAETATEEETETAKKPAKAKATAKAKVEETAEEPEAKKKPAKAKAAKAKVEAEEVAEEAEEKPKAVKAKAKTKKVEAEVEEEEEKKPAKPRAKKAKAEEEEPEEKPKAKKKVSKSKAGETDASA